MERLQPRIEPGLEGFLALDLDPLDVAEGGLAALRFLFEIVEQAHVPTCFRAGRAGRVAAQGNAKGAATQANALPARAGGQRYST